LTKEDIIRMAQEAGFSIDDLYPNASIQEIERFAILVASYTWREQALSEVQKVGQVIEEIQAAVLAEREACAEICKKHADFYAELEPSPIAQSAWAACIDNRDTIRARGSHD
jgi:hypothetical protein